ncbi:MAG TPA: TonB family protein [Pyrinomonadaceae bacterium]|nr:TonB family protein [Pyrinomonadaceae bacterium]
MPLNVRRLFASLFLVVLSFFIINAQTTTAPTSGEIMRGRISKAKALIAVKNYNAAIYEMENIRRETNDQTVHGVLNVLLMNCYLEQGDYKRAQDFLGTLFNDIKANKPNAAANYYAAAGQVIKGARNQSDRYKALGLMVSDRNLPPEAATDLEKMRETLEKVVEQSKVLGKDTKQTSNASVLLEETSNARSLLARDDYDAQRWKNEVADSREMLANSRSTVLNATNEAMPETSNVSQTLIASNTPTNTLPVPGVTPATTKTEETVPTFQPVKETKPNADLTAKIEKPVVNEPVKETPKKEEPKKTDETPNNIVPTESLNQPKRERRIVKPDENKDTTIKTETADANSPLSVGSLLEYAVQRTNPVYPPTARTLRQTGVVRLEVVVDEEGKVSTVQNLTGPALLQGAAKDAVKKWKFKPFLRDGQPVKATGFLSFNFNL